jgi:hypothetical protein
MCNLKIVLAGQLQQGDEMLSLKKSPNGLQQSPKMSPKLLPNPDFVKLAFLINCEILKNGQG